MFTARQTKEHRGKNGPPCDPPCPAPLALVDYELAPLSLQSATQFTKRKESDAEIMRAKQVVSRPTRTLQSRSGARSQLNTCRTGRRGEARSCSSRGGRRDIDGRKSEQYETAKEVIGLLSQHVRLRQLIQSGRACPHRLSPSGGHIHRGLCCKSGPRKHHSAVPLIIVPRQCLHECSLPLVSKLSRASVDRWLEEVALFWGCPRSRSSLRARTGREFARGGKKQEWRDFAARPLIKYMNSRMRFHRMQPRLAHLARVYDEHHRTSAQMAKTE